RGADRGGLLRDPSDDRRLRPRLARPPLLHDHRRDDPRYLGPDGLHPPRHRRHVKASEERGTFALEKDSLRVLLRALEELDEGFAGLPAFPGGDPPAANSFEEILLEAARRLRDNYPYFHPLYAGQMLKPPHPIARAAYALAMTINPNNHARDGGRASSDMEIEAVAEIGRMFGWTEFLGHLTSGGTMANLEAVGVVGET